MTQISPAAQEVFDLSKRYSVSLYAACKRANVSRGTPERWKRLGTDPMSSKALALKNAIIEIAKERGTFQEDAEAQA